MCKSNDIKIGTKTWDVGIYLYVYVFTWLCTSIFTEIKHLYAQITMYKAEFLPNVDTLRIFNKIWGHHTWKSIKLINTYSFKCNKRGEIIIFKTYKA